MADHTAPLFRAPACALRTRLRAADPAPAPTERLETAVERRSPAPAGRFSGWKPAPSPGDDRGGQAA